MILFDATRSGPARPRSGLTRVPPPRRPRRGRPAGRVRCQATPRPPAGGPAGGPRPDDWFVTAELFSEEERPGFTDFLRTHPGRRAAIFHDAIPLRHPHFTWPRSVARHPGYLKLLAGFDRVWAVSRASRDELLGFWRWQGVALPPPVEVLPLGADFDGSPRRAPQAPGAPPSLLCLGILEPRKHQDFLLTVCETLWDEGLDFVLHVVGRENPHFGRPIRARLARLQRRRGRRLRYHGAADDATVAGLYATARATVFPTQAEGCGLPLLESLWRGVPCVCSDLPALRENAAGGGCVLLPVGDSGAWTGALRRVLLDDSWHRRLQSGVASRTLPTWAEAARLLAAGLE